MKKAWAMLCFSLCLSMLAFSVNRVSAASTAVAVDPPNSTVNFLDTFSVNVNVTNVVNLTSWQLNLYYLNSILNCTGAVEGPFLKSGSSTYFGDTITNNYNSTYGLLVAYSTQLGMTGAVNGGGVILTVTFKAVGEGNTNLTLANTKLGNEQIPPQPISHVDYSGAVSVSSVSPDVAVPNVTSPKTVIGQGLSGNITVTTENLGGTDETINVTVYYANSTIYVLQSQYVTVPKLISKDVTFTWNTAGLAKGNYTISAYALPVPGETNTANNNFTDGWVIISIPGDIAGKNGLPDGKVDMKDIATVAAVFGSKLGDSNWNPNADLNNDGKVDMKDIALVAAKFGNVDP